MPTIRITSHLLWLLVSGLALAACQPSPADIQATIDAQVAIAVVATQTAMPTATSYATATMPPTQAPLSTATEFPEQPALATATAYPTATPYPTHTPEPTNTPAPIPPTVVPAAQPPRAENPQPSPLQTQMALLDQMTLMSNMFAEFQGLVGGLTISDNPDCNRMIQIYDTIKAMPEMDVSGTELIVQQAYAAYRSAIEHFTKPETSPGDIATLCRTQPENVNNISNMQLNAIVLYVGQSTEIMRNAYYAIGGR